MAPTHHPDGTPKSRPPADDSGAAQVQHSGAMNSYELRARLDELSLERLEAESVGLTSCEPYMKDLENEICECREALVGTTVTEIAVARAELHGPLQG
jgi:hypothetical protein